MKFLVDAQLPRRLAVAINAADHDAIHTLDLPDGNNTSDAQINAISEEQERIVISKDADFVNTFLLQQKPYKLLLVSTGNITNNELEALFPPQLPAIVKAFEEHSFVELNRESLIIHA